MGIRRQPGFGLQLPPKIFQILLGDAALQVRPRIDTGSSVTLEVNDVAGVFGGFGPEKMVKTDFIQGCAGGIRGNMPAQAGIAAIGPYDHRHGIPANDALDAAFDFAAAGKYRLALNGNGIDVGGIGGVVELDPLLLGMGLKASQQPSHAVRTLILINVVKRLEPLPVFILDFSGSLLWVLVIGLHRVLLSSISFVIKLPDLRVGSQSARERCIHQIQ